MHYNMLLYGLYGKVRNSTQFKSHSKSDETLFQGQQYRSVCFCTNPFRAVRNKRLHNLLKNMHPSTLPHPQKVMNFLG